MGHYLSYFRASLRLWRRHFIGVFIALAGLSAAFAVVILTGFYVYDGVRSDAWLPGVDTLYSLNEQPFLNGKPVSFGRNNEVHPQLAAFARDNLAEAVQAGRLFEDRHHKVVAKQGDTSFDIHVTFADPAIASLLPLPVLKGDLAAVLADPAAIALTAREAARLFRGDAMGQTLEVHYGDTVQTYRVGAVLRDIPPNSQLKLTMLVGWNDGFIHKLNGSMGEWGGALVYVRLKPGVFSPAFAEEAGKRLSALVPLTQAFSFDVGIEPVLGAQYASDTYSVMKPRTNAKALQVLVAISAVLVLVAGFNAANLLSAINMGRLREVAVRRVSGAGRGHLVRAMLVENVGLCLTAYAVAMLLASDLEPLVRNLVGGDIPVLVVARLPLLALGAGASVLIGAAGALVLAWYVTRVRPQALLRTGGASLTATRSWGRQVFIGMQALAVVVTLVAAAQIAWQVRHLLTRERGFKVDGLMFIEAPDDSQKALFAGSFQEAVKGLPGVSAVDLSFDTPYGNGPVMVANMRTATMPDPIQVSQRYVGPDYMAVLHVKPAAELAEDWRGRQHMVALTRKAARAFGFKKPADALGAILLRDNRGKDGKVEQTEYHVAAVLGWLDDARYRVRAPLIYMLEPLKPNWVRTMMVVTDSGRTDAVTTALTALWNRNFPDKAPHIELLSDRFKDAQARNIHVGEAAIVVAGLSALLCFAGLYGMASYWVATRRRELALRRVLGADGAQVTRLFLRKMLAPILAGGLLALVPAWWLMQEWLQTTGRDRAALPYSLYALVLVVVLALSAIILVGHIRRVLAIRPATVLHHE